MEHVLSWAVLAALHRVTGDGIADSNAILLACPSGEWHTLPLEALRAALAGIAAQMLGASVPAYALAAALKRCTRHATAVLWSQTPTTARGSALRAALAGGACGCSRTMVDHGYHARQHLPCPQPKKALRHLR